MHLHRKFMGEGKSVPDCHCKWCIGSKALIWALCGWMYGCTGTAHTTDPSDADIPFIPGCCHITHLEEPDASSVWGYNTYTCGDTQGIPWVCLPDSGGGYACDDPHCHLGSSCQSVNGTGEVISCGDE